jgi:hypothetical protein
MWAGTKADKKVGLWVVYSAVLTAVPWVVVKAVT